MMKGAETLRPLHIGPVRKLSDELESWLASEADKTVGGLVDVFRERSFAVLFVLLLAVPALPLPTGGATHLFEVIAVLGALQLVVGRDEIWLPQRWRGIQLVGDKRERFLRALLKLIRRLERISRPRLAFLFDRRASNIVYGLLVILGSAAAFLAPPFTGLDTLPSLGVVVLSLGVLFKDALIVLLGLVTMTVGVVLEIVLGAAAIRGIWGLF